MYNTYQEWLEHQQLIIQEREFLIQKSCDEYDKKIEQLKQEEWNKNCTLILENLKKIGIDYTKYSFDGFIQEFEYQRKLYRASQSFLKDISKGLIISGRSGIGKTYISLCMVMELIKQKHQVEILKWLEQGRYLKSIVNNTELYYKEISRYKNAKILYIDDFLKVGKNSMPSDADLTLSFEILDYRTNLKLPTIITSERTLKEILDIDESVCGRIVELCKIKVQITNEEDVKNYRLRNN